MKYPYRLLEQKLKVWHLVLEQREREGKEKWWESNIGGIWMINWLLYSNLVVVVLYVLFFFLSNMQFYNGRTRKCNEEIFKSKPPQDKKRTSKDEKKSWGIIYHASQSKLCLLSVPYSIIWDYWLVYWEKNYKKNLRANMIFGRKSNGSFWYFPLLFYVDCRAPAGNLIE